VPEPGGPQAAAGFFASRVGIDGRQRSLWHAAVCSNRNALSVGRGNVRLQEPRSSGCMLRNCARPKGRAGDALRVAGRSGLLPSDFMFDESGAAEPVATPG